MTEQVLDPNADWKKSQGRILKWKFTSQGLSKFGINSKKMPQARH